MALERFMIEREPHAFKVWMRDTRRPRRVVIERFRVGEDATLAEAVRILKTTRARLLAGIECGAVEATRQPFRSYRIPTAALVPMLKSQGMWPDYSAWLSEGGTPEAPYG